MENYSDISTNNTRWGYMNILETDLEQLEFSKNFDYKHDVYSSILDTEANYNVLLNFREEEQEVLYVYDEEEDSADTNSNLNNDDEDDYIDRNSYRDRDMDDVYYLI